MNDIIMGFFYRENDLGISESAIKILKRNELTSHAFLKEEFHSIELGLGHA